MSQDNQDKRKIFNTVKNHLLRQNKRSVNWTGDVCAYRGDNGLKCAVGCLISNKAYHKELEGQIVTEKWVKFALIESGIPADDDEVLSMLGKLQRIHDTVQIYNWPGVLKDLEESLFGDQ